MRKFVVLVTSLSFLCGAVFAQKKVEPFKKNDRVVFAGNSITEAGLYGSYIWLYYMTHFPDRRIEVINGGVGGDVAGQIYSRLDSDILKKKPTVLAVTFGMNDSKYFEYLDKKNPVTEAKRKEIVKESFDSYVKIENKLKQLPKVTKILMASSPYDETVKLKGDVFVGKTKTMQEIIDFQLASAKQNNWGFVDFFAPMTEINIREQKTNPEYTNTGTDRIHPGSAGHFVMAYIFLKQQNLAGLPVADVKIDAAANKLIKAVNSSVSNLKSAKNKVSFDYLAKSLPYPIDTAARVWQNPQVQEEALKVIPFVKEFDEEKLTITGLSGNYTLKIDGHKIGQWPASAFAEGINLAILKNTPQYKQALEILSLNNDRRGIEAKYRNYYWVQYDFLKDKGLLFNTTSAARDTITNNLKKNGWLNAKKDDYYEVADHGAEVQSKMDSLIDKIYTINKPVKRHIEIEEVL